MEENKSVLAYAIENLTALFEEFKKDNKECHNEIIAHQKKTNGDVRRLKIWRAYIIGGTIVLGFIISMTSLPRFLNYLGYETKPQTVNLSDDAIQQIKEEITNDVMSKIENEGEFMFVTE